MTLRKRIRRFIRHIQKYYIDICPKCQQKLLIDLDYNKKAYKYCSRCGDMWV